MLVYHTHCHTIPPCVLQVTFTERATLPNLIRFMHSSGYSGLFRQLGDDVSLSADGEPRLKQTYLLGAAHTPVQQYLRMTLVGHLSLPAAGAYVLCEKAVRKNTRLAH